MKASTKNVLKELARSRNWRGNEFEEFAKVLADEENVFAVSLEKLALKNLLITKYSLNEKLLLFELERS